MATAISKNDFYKEFMKNKDINFLDKLLLQPEDIAHEYIIELENKKIISIKSKIVSC